MTPAVPDAPAFATVRPSELPQGESQWTIILREFRKRRSAVACYYVIVLLALVSIFAPFLANDRPIAYRGYNPNEYNEARKAASALIGQLAAPASGTTGQSPEFDAAMAYRGAIDRLGQMQQVLVSDQREQIAQLMAEVTQAAESRNVTELQRLQSAVSRLNARDMTFVTSWRFPVFAALDGVDVAFLVAALLFLSSPLGKWLLRRVLGTSHPWVTRGWVVIQIGGPLLVAIGWWLVVPAQNDLTPYKRGLLATSEADAVRRAPVVYASVTWPPIPFALDEIDLNAIKQPPLWQQPQSDTASDDAPRNGIPAGRGHWLGTDTIGRDLACRMIWGGRVSLAVGVVGVSIYVTIGILIGALAGYFRGWVDLVISRIIEVVICFPSFFLILAIVAFVGPSMMVIMIVIGLTSWTGVARLARAEFLRLSEQDFVQAARALGYSHLRIIFRHVLPNAMAPVLVSATFGVAGAILTESALSFLGLGITIPKPSWGGILSDGRDAIFSAAWIIVYPGAAIFVTITCYNLVGEAFRDAADPRLRGSR